MSGDPALCDPEAPPLFGRADGCMVVPAPLYHNGPIVWSCSAWLAGSHVVVLPRFDAEATLEAIDRYRADTVYLVPTMMKRIWRLPEEVRRRLRSVVSSVRLASGRALPAWLKQVWIDWLGPERIFELYAGTEAQAATIITGTEWLAHRGSVGRPMPGTVMICDPEGTSCRPAGRRGVVAHRAGPADLPLHRRHGTDAVKADGSRSGTWDGSTRTTISTWVTGSRT